MNAAVGVTSSILNVAGVCGVPFTGAVAILLQDIIKVCNQIASHKEKTSRLVSHCSKLLALLDERQSLVASTELQTTLDETFAALQKVYAKLNRLSNCGKLKALWCSSDIESTLMQCQEDILALINHFQVRSSDLRIFESNRSSGGVCLHILHHHKLHETHRDTHNQLADIQDRLVQIYLQGEQHRSTLQGTLFPRDEDRALAELTQEGGALPKPFSKVANYGDPYQPVLDRLHRASGPHIKILNGEIQRHGDLAMAGGVYSEIWLGSWLRNGDAEKVALKALRHIRAADGKAQSHFVQEIRVWSGLSHKNILPFYGVVTNLGSELHIVSPWQEYGNVLEYLRTNPAANRHKLIYGAALGLRYLHEQGVVHGNVKCANILVDVSGVARICDFGVSKLVEEITDQAATETLSNCGSARWLAPELMDGTMMRASCATDTYSFAMAILELLTGKHPFPHVKTDTAVICNIVMKRVPHPRPESPPEIIGHWLSDELWSLMECCWSLGTRPSMHEVVTRLSSML
ncbi:kinase-like protein [Pluteus cervinus]|uniref:Kinase-like protein n=1 Tax=Pluteus cervinus TaxID=181527 RepID=A0ACD3ARD1_9AGAR|nr:kinase-like protein [Pluteus cervinus]